jgi:hypothetical protein
MGGDAMPTSLMLVLALALRAGAPQTPTPTPNPALIRIFVETAAEGEAIDLPGRRESVKDLTAAVADKKKTLAVVALERDADVVIEVSDRRVETPKFVTGLGPRPGESLLMMEPTRTVVLQVKLTSGDQTLGFTNKNKPLASAPGWRSAANDVIGQIDKWIAAHRAEILKRRGAPSATADARSAFTR